MKKKSLTQPNTVPTAENLSPKKSDALPEETSQAPQALAVPPNVVQWIEQLGLKPLFDSLETRFNRLEEQTGLHKQAIEKLITILQQKGLTPLPSEGSAAADQPVLAQPVPPPSQQPPQPNNPGQSQTPGWMQAIAGIGPDVVKALTAQPEAPPWMQDYIQASLNNALTMQSANINLTQLVQAVLAKQLNAPPAPAGA